MSENTGWITVVALIVAVLALVVAAVAIRTARRAYSLTDRHQRRLRARGNEPLPTDVAALRSEVEALRLEATDALRHLAVVRYDAFGDMGGHLSWSVALLDDNGNGIVLTAIHGRSEARTYAKNIVDWSCDQPLSPEEEEAVQLARAEQSR